MSEPEKASEKKKSKTDRELFGKPFMIGLLALVTVITGLVATIMGLLFYLIDDLKTKLEVLASKAPIEIGVDIIALLIIVAGIVVIISGIGLFRQTKWAFFLYIIAALGIIIGTIFFFRTSPLSKIAISVLSVLAGIVIGENEYYIGSKKESKEGVTFVLKVLSLGTLITGIISLLVGILVIIDDMAEMDLKIAGWIQEGGINQLETALLTEPLLIGVALIIGGVIAAIAGFGLFKRISIAWYLFLLAFFIFIVILFAINPFELVFWGPALLIIAVGIIGGVIWSKSEYFTRTII